MRGQAARKWLADWPCDEPGTGASPPPPPLKIEDFEKRLRRILLQNRARQLHEATASPLGHTGKTLSPWSHAAHDITRGYWSSLSKPCSQGGLAQGFSYSWCRRRPVTGESEGAGNLWLQTRRTRPETDTTTPKQQGSSVAGSRLRPGGCQGGLPLCPDSFRCSGAPAFRADMAQVGLQQTREELCILRVAQLVEVRAINEKSLS